MDNDKSDTPFPKRRSTIQGNVAIDVGPGAAAFVATYQAGHMPNFEGNDARQIHPGGSGFVLRIKPGPDNMPTGFVEYLQKHTSAYISGLPSDEQRCFNSAIEGLKGEGRSLKEQALRYLRGLAARQGASNLSMELAHWLAGDFFYGNPLGRN